MKTVLVDRKNCIACENCTRVCPSIFTMKDGKSSPKKQVTEEENSDVEMAIAQCPVSVIFWEGQEPKKEQSRKKSGGFFAAIQSFFSSSAKSETRNLVLQSRTFLTKEVAVFTFSHDGLSFLPGQFLTLLFPGEGEEIARSYSFLDGGKKTVSFGIHLTPNGKGSAFLRTMKIGESINAKGPFGNFLLRENENPKVFLATGTGVVPIANMLAHYTGTGEKTLLFGVRTERDIFFQKPLSKIPNLNFSIVLSRPEKRDKKPQRITDILRQMPLKPETEFYLCGNTAMISEAQEILRERNISAEKVILEHFS